MTEHTACRVCGNTALSRWKESNMPPDLCADDFRISNARYGVTGTLVRCDRCGYIQAADLEDVLRFYEEMDDPEYLASAEARSIQERKLLERLREYVPGGRLLDVGAGSGILMREAAAMGYETEGVEPSRTLGEHAARLGTSIHRGVLPHPDVRGTFDAITVVDVIEHVPTPVELMKDVASVLSPQGYGIVVTPDIDSLAARMAGHRWWHLRMAHIGYFNRHNLSLALDRAGLEPVAFGRPGWYFPAGYLLSRLNAYLPNVLKIRHIPQIDVTIPLNLYDSLFVIFKKK